MFPGQETAYFIFFSHSCLLMAVNGFAIAVIPQQRSPASRVYFHSLWHHLSSMAADVPHPPGSQAATNSSIICQFLKTTGSLLLKTIRPHWPRPTGKSIVRKSLCFPQIITLGPRSGDVAFPVHQSAFSGESHQVLMLLTVCFSPKHLIIFKKKKKEKKKGAFWCSHFY